MTKAMDQQTGERHSSVAGVLECRARRTPDQTAYGMLDADFHLSAVTYGELFRRVSVFASRLSGFKIAGGDRCLLMFQQGIDFIAALLACNRIGAIPVPVNMPARNKSLARWENIAVNSGARCLITEQAGVASLSEIRKNSAVLSALPVYSEQEGALAWTMPGSNELAFLQYTSGSTGEPKGVMVTHASLMNNLGQLEATLAVDENSVMVSWLPFYHDMGLILGILLGIYAGCRVILMRPADFMQQPLNWLKAISVYGATHTAAPNFAYELAADKLEKLTRAGGEHISLQSLERVVCGAEPVHLNTLLKFSRAARPFGLGEDVLNPGYGLAEASLVVSTYKKGQPAGWLKLDRNALQSGAVSVLDRGRLDDAPAVPAESTPGETYLVGNGFVVDGHRLTVRNPVDGTGLGPQAIGEICFAGPSVAKGYWNRPAETEQTFPGDEKTGEVYLKTGDLGFKDTNGELYITGRIKDLIIIRGMNHYPQDIERTAFSADPDLRTDGAAAFSVVRDGEEKLVLIQEVNRPAVRSPRCGSWAKKIRAAVLKVHGIPVEAIVFIPPLRVPRTTSGKIQRNKARSMYLNNQWDKVVGVSALEEIGGRGPAAAAGIDSREALADYIAALVAEQLAVPAAEIDRDMPFMELGVNSMMSLSVRNALEQTLGFIIPAAALFNYNTVRQMGGYLFDLKNNPGGGPARGETGAAGVVPLEAELDKLSENELLELLEKELEGAGHAYRNSSQEPDYQESAD